MNGGKKEKPLNTCGFFVGVARFELATTWSQTRYANQTALHPENDFLYFIFLKIKFHLGSLHPERTLR